MRSTTDSLLTQDRRETMARSLKVAVREGVREAMNESSADERERRSGRSRGRWIPRGLLLAGLGAAVRYLRRRAMRGSESDSGRSIRTSDGSADGNSGGRGRGTLSMLFRLGVVVALGYALWRRFGSTAGTEPESGSGSMGETITEASDRTRRLAEMTASRAGWAAGRIDAATSTAADRIETGGETAADRIQEGGEGAAEQFEEAADATESVAQEVEEGMASEGGGDGNGTDDVAGGDGEATGDEAEAVDGDDSDDEE